MRIRLVGLGVGFLLVAGSLFAQPARRTPITDPDRLAALGLPRESADVFEWQSSASAATAAASAAPESWGTATGFTTVSALDLGAEHGSALVREPDRAYCSLGSGGGSFAQEALVQLHLPEGAGLQSLSVWGYDEEPTYGMTATLYEFCQAVGFNPPTTTLVGATATLGSGGYTFDSTPLFGYRVNNRDCGYSVRVIFIPGDVTCRSDQIQFRKLSVLWNREVSEAPATATFSDVPTTHLLFQFIEALAKSGITSGCGAGAFCPDMPLTRGQMAVFLAKGLGMGWP